MRVENDYIIRCGGANSLLREFDIVMTIKRLGNSSIFSFSYLLHKLIYH